MAPSSIRTSRGTAPRLKRLIVCADDYGFTPGISRSIRELLEARRISATSVMAGIEYWPGEAAALKAVAGNADIGLHVTLTDHVPLGPMPTFAPDGRFPAMGAVYKAGLLRRLPLAEIQAEIERQLARFIEHYGAPPSHIDGHHHVHQLPGVRDIVVDLARKVGRGRTWVRSCRERPSLVRSRGVATAKALIIGSLGGGIAHRAKRADVAINQGFSGAYDYLSETRQTAQLFERFVMDARENTLVMCHPGYADSLLASRDAMTTPRDAEHAYFMSETWPCLLSANGLELGPYRHP